MELLFRFWVWYDVTLNGLVLSDLVSTLAPNGEDQFFSSSSVGLMVYQPYGYP